MVLHDSLITRTVKRIILDKLKVEGSWIKFMLNESEWKSSYYEVKDGPPVPKIPRDPIFEAWESFSITSFEFNCFDFGNWEDLLNYAESFGLPFYSEFCKMEEKIKDCATIFDNGFGMNDRYNWFISSFYEKMLGEMRYRGWVYNHIEYSIQA
jgi:hypothetical protein